MIRSLCLITTVLLLSSQRSLAEQQEVSILTIGNSFAGNALTNLPELAKEAGHTLIVGRANLGGCTLERHWNHVAAFEADPESKEGSPYEKGTRSLSEMLKSRKWDLITVQQASMKTHDLATYYPFAADLVGYVRQRAPDSKILAHQTWAYRVDDSRFAPEDTEDGPSSQKEMYEQVRSAYHTLAKDLDLGILPSGDAMYLADTDPNWGYQPDPEFDPKKAIYPELPEQEFSLHTGWRWRKSGNGTEQKLGMDGHHANSAGCYLLGCTWFEVIFGESVVGNQFVHEKLDPEYASFLQSTAHRAISRLKTHRAEPDRTSRLPRLPAELAPENQNFQQQKELPDLAEPYVSTSPEDLGDGLQVGNLDVPGAQQAVSALMADDKAGKYSNLDSLLLWKDGKLLFEMYSRRGRVDAPHYAMSVTKTLTSVTLARAIQVGLLSMEDLDKPVISFMPEIDRSRIQPGVETITLRDALFMKSGLRFEDKQFLRTIGPEYPRQQYFQKLFENTAPITPESKEYKYTGTDPSIIMMIIDLQVPGPVQEFISKEVAGKFGSIYCWDDQACGIPKCGAGSNFTSRSLLKIGTAIIQGGKYNGQQLLSADYVKQVMDTNKGQGYFYYFHNRSKGAANGRINFISGIGAGGQYMSTFPDLNIVAVATAHNTKGIDLPLQAVLEHLIPLFQQ